MQPSGSALANARIAPAQPRGPARASRLDDRRRAGHPRRRPSRAAGTASPLESLQPWTGSLRGPARGCPEATRPGIGRRAPASRPPHQRRPRSTAGRRSFPVATARARRRPHPPCASLVRAAACLADGAPVPADHRDARHPGGDRPLGLPAAVPGARPGSRVDASPVVPATTTARTPSSTRRAAWPAVAAASRRPSSWKRVTEGHAVRPRTAAGAF